MFEGNTEICCSAMTNRSTYQLHSCVEKNVEFTFLEYIKISMKIYKTPVLYLFSELGKIFKYRILVGRNLIIPIFHLFHDLGKIGTSSLEQYSKFPMSNLFVNWKKIGSTA